MSRAGAESRGRLPDAGRSGEYRTLPEADAGPAVGAVMITVVVDAGPRCRYGAVIQYKRPTAPKATSANSRCKGPFDAARTIVTVSRGGRSGSDISISQLLRPPLLTPSNQRAGRGCPLREVLRAGEGWWATSYRGRFRLPCPLGLALLGLEPQLEPRRGWPRRAASAYGPRIPANNAANWHYKPH